MATTASAHFDYLIVGSGAVADIAAEGIRERDSAGSIGILREQADSSPAHAMTTPREWDDPEFGVLDAIADRSAPSLVLDATVAKIERETRTLTTTTGERFHFDKLLLATGGRPRRVDLPDDPRIIWFSTAADRRRLREIAERHSHVAVVGGSFVGTELAAALTDHGCSVTFVFPDEVLGSSIFPPEVARRFHESFLARGVDLRPCSRVNGGSIDDRGVTLELADGTSILVDAVVSGLGIKPNVELAREAGLMTATGIVVDEHLRTSDTHIYAAGDAAEYPDVLLGRRRVEHVDGATVMGHTAGRNMAGEPEDYDHTPYYYSVVFGDRYEGVGAIDASFATVEDWAVPHHKGVIYYVRDGFVSGVLLVNVPGRVEEARDIIARAPSLRGHSLAGLIRI